MSLPLKDKITFQESSILSLLLVAIACFFIYSDWLWRLDHSIYDWHLRWWSQPPTDNILIVAIDTQSLKELGRWPWPRRLHAKIIDNLTAAGAKVIALDIVFAEASTDDPVGDNLLAQALKKSGRVVLPVILEELRSGGQLIEVLPIPPLAATAAKLGHVDIELEQDGIVRSTYLKAGLGSSYWPTLALAMLDLAHPVAEHMLPGEQHARTQASSQHTWIRNHRILIPFTGPPGHFPAVSYVDILRNKLSPEILRDKFVLVGVTARGLTDALATPVSGQKQPMAGVEFNAHVLNTLQQSIAIRPLSMEWRMLLIASLAVFLPWLYPRLSLRQAGIMVILALLGTLTLSVLLSKVLQIWFNPAPALVVLSLSYPLWSWRHLKTLMGSIFEEEERTQVTLQAIGDGVITTNGQGQIEKMNPKAEILTGWSLKEAHGQSLDRVLRLIDEHNGITLKNPVNLCLERDNTVELEEKVLLVNALGQAATIRVSASPIRNRGGKIAGVVVAMTDLSETHRLSKQLSYQTNYDVLTELPNRHLLRNRLTQAIAYGHQNKQIFALLIVDLDRFKTVNDSLGLAVGDKLLKAVAERLKQDRREEDTVARLGSDEFALVLENLSEQAGAVSVTEKLLSAMEKPFHIDDYEFFVSCSIGVSLFPKDGEEVELLLKNADRALQQAKENGRNTVQFYAQTMNRQNLDRLVMEHNLRHALARQELEIHYQPQVELINGQIIGVEALLRWRHPQLGLISPAEFIPLAEETGLIVSIGEWVLKTACSQGKSWQREGIAPIKVAVNLSPRQFMQTNLTDMIKETLAETGLEPCYLDLEITESLIVKNVEEVIPILHTLKSIGVQLSIDDFGTGYSSLNYLKRFPIDQIKIDKTFVRDINTDLDDSAIALAVIAMAHSMKLKVLAEGVETKTQLTFLKTNRCDEMQGFYLSCPLPVAETTHLLQSHTHLNFN
jgi:diguanylate cyclase (GGDEF)-like protein/PAS domain S-box-containing protein